MESLPETPEPPANPPQPDVLRKELDRYWHKNLIIMGALLFIWAILGLGCGVLFADTLNQWRLPGTGYPLGFWFAQQGSIVSFVAIILTYCLIMNKIDREHHLKIEKIQGTSKNSTG